MPAEIQVPGFEFQSWYFDSDSDAQIEQTGNIEIYRIERERERERERNDSPIWDLVPTLVILSKDQESDADWKIKRTVYKFVSVYVCVCVCV